MTRTTAENSLKWTRQEPGWYVHPKLGEIQLLPKKSSEVFAGYWCWYPAYAPDEVKHRKGPFSTLREAKRIAEWLTSSRN